MVRIIVDSNSEQVAMCRTVIAKLCQNILFKESEGTTNWLVMLLLGRYPTSSGSSIPSFCTLWK